MTHTPANTAPSNQRSQPLSICSKYGHLHSVNSAWREFYALDPESWAVLTSGGNLQAGIGDLFLAIFNPRPTDLVAVGVDKMRMFDADREFPGCQLRVGSGPSGGELALIEDLDITHIATRFNGLTIGSGDGEFTDTAIAARAAGLRVRVASWRNRLSSRLGCAADEIVLLDNFEAHPAAITSRPHTLRGVAPDTNPGLGEAA